MKVKFLPDNIEFEIEPNQSVLELAQKNNVFIKSICNGVPNCAECRVQLVEGDHNVLPPLSKELALIGTAHFIDQRRLACQLKCFGDITVDLTEQKEKQKMEGTKKRLKAGVRAEEEVSFAKTGNLIDQENDILSQVGTEADKKSENDEDYGHNVSIDQQVNSDPVRANKKKQNRSNNRPNRNPNQNKNKQQASSEDGEPKKASKNNRRNRNRKNFNKKRNTSNVQNQNQNQNQKPKT